MDHFVPSTTRGHVQAAVSGHEKAVLHHAARGTVFRSCYLPTRHLLRTRFVGKILPMRGLRFSVRNQSQVVAAGRRQVFMSQQVLNMTDGTPIRQERRGHRVTKHVRVDALRKARPYRMSPELLPDPRGAQPAWLEPLSREQRRIIVVTV